MLPPTFHGRILPSSILPTSTQLPISENLLLTCRAIRKAWYSQKKFKIDRKMPTKKKQASQFRSQVAYLSAHRPLSTSRLILLLCKLRTLPSKKTWKISQIQKKKTPLFNVVTCSNVRLVYASQYIQNTSPSALASSSFALIYSFLVKVSRCASQIDRV